MWIGANEPLNGFGNGMACTRDILLQMDGDTKNQTTLMVLRIVCVFTRMALGLIIWCNALCRYMCEKRAT